MATVVGCGWSGWAVSLSVRVPEGPAAWNRSPWRPRSLGSGNRTAQPSCRSARFP